MCLLKTGAWLIQVHLNVFAFSGHEYDCACLIQVACLIEVATKTDFTVHVSGFLSVCVYPSI